MNDTKKPASPDRDKLTKTTVEKLPLPDKGQVIVWDPKLSGFGVRLTPGGRAYIAQGRVCGRTRRVSLGKHGVITADKARDKARKALGDMKDGKDPGEEKRMKEAQTLTLKEVAEAYIKDHRKLKESSIYDINRHIRTTFRDWADRPVVGIDRDKVLRKFRQRSDESRAQANQGFRVLRALINYANATCRPNGDPLLKENPVSVLSDTGMWHTVAPRKGRIPTAKVGEVWNYLQGMRSAPDQTIISRTVADATCFMLLTGTRKGEALNLEWQHVDLEDRSFRLLDPKNRNPVTIPLSEALVEILEGRPRLNEYIFPGRMKGRLKDIRWSVDKLSEIAGQKIIPHDLRRTFRAIAGEAGVEYSRIKILMNHSIKADVTLHHYTETDDVRYLRDDAEKITQWLLRQAQQAAAGNVTDLITRRTTG